MVVILLTFIKQITWWLTEVEDDVIEPYGAYPEIFCQSRNLVGRIIIRKAIIFERSN